jgi:DNA-binding transcriptional LysR family regulator
MAERQRIRDWRNLQFFLAVAKTGSFQSAAKALGTDQSTVARRMHRLEEELEAKLFDRHAHGMMITDAGQRIIAKIAAIESAVVDVEKSLLGLETGEHGLVTIAVTEGIGSIWLISTLMEFYERFPRIDLRIKTNQRDIDLLSHDADISIQLEKPDAVRMVAYKATKIAHRLFVSQSYIDRNGLPKSVDEFPGHEFLDYEPYHSESYAEWWVKGVLSTARVRLTCNSANIYLSATRQGVGIGLFPAFYVRTAPDIIPLPIAVPCESQIWVVTHEETNKSARVRAVQGFLRERFIADRAAWFYPAR